MHRVVLLVVGADVPQTSPAPHVPKKHGCPRFEIGWHFFESVFASLQARPSDSKQPTGARVATNQNSQPFALQLASQESPARPCENAAHTPAAPDWSVGTHATGPISDLHCPSAASLIEHGSPMACVAATKPRHALRISTALQVCAAAW